MFDGGFARHKNKHLVKPIHGENTREMVVEVIPNITQGWPVSIFQRTKNLETVFPNFPKHHAFPPRPIFLLVRQTEYACQITENFAPVERVLFPRDLNVTFQFRFGLFRDGAGIEKHEKTEYSPC